jgi:predicted methyltransferase
MKLIAQSLTLIPLVCALLLPLTTVAADEAFAATRAKLETAMQGEARGEKDIARDKNRKPIETLEFFELRDDMTVVELFPGGGWYTKLLAPTLADKGKYYAAFGTSSIGSQLAGKAGFEKIEIVGTDAKLGPYEADPRFYAAANTDLGISDADIVFTFRNYHNFDAESRASINASMFKALKSGGIYAVVDHTRRHMQATDGENRRRIDPVLAIKEIQAAGFVFEDFSDLHYRLDDELRYEVGRRSVTGNTDRWTLKFRKP